MDNSESSELQGVDHVMGTHLAQAFEGVSVITGPKEFQMFTRRARKDRIFRFDYDGDPKKIIASYWAKLEKKPQLPIVLYYREPGINNDELVGDIKEESWLYSEEFEATYNLSLLPVNLTYNMAFLTRDKASLDKLQVEWYKFISKPKNKRTSVNFTIAGQKFPVPLEIKDHKSILFSHTPIQDDGKLFCVECTIECKTQLLSGEETSLTPHIEFIGLWETDKDVKRNYICEDEANDLYICIHDHTTSVGMEPSGNTTDWLLFNNYEDRGFWNLRNTYQLCDLAAIPGEGYYLCIEPHDPTDENKPGTGSQWVHFCESEAITNPATIDIIGERVGIIE